jgi:hypothetical protein
MRTIWNILAVMAIVNLLALAGGVAWLKATDRLSRDRIVQMQERFVKTVAQEQSDKEAAAEEAKRKEADQAKAKKLAEPPTTAAEKIAEQQLKDDQRLQVLLRQQQELDNLRISLMANLARVEDREKKLAAEKLAFAAERKRIADTDGDKQFLVALNTLEGQKPKDAKQVLQALLDQKQTTQVVSYLARMEEGKRAKVIAEFVKGTPSVAADLLERLRTRGIVVPSPGSLSQAPANESTGIAAANGTDAGKAAQPAP